MKIIFILSLFLMLFYSNTSFAVNCADIKMDSSVNIIKKLKCKTSNNTVSSESTASETVEKKEKKKNGWSLWKKPEWMKKKN